MTPPAAPLWACRREQGQARVACGLRSAANSVAIVRDKKSTKRYKLRTGDQVGRLRVAQIRPKDVVFTIEDFGFERQETLSLRKQEDVTQ